MTRRQKREPSLEEIRRLVRAARAPEVKEVRDLVKRAGTYMGMARFLMEDGAADSASVYLARARNILHEYLLRHPGEWVKEISYSTPNPKSAEASCDAE